MRYDSLQKPISEAEPCGPDLDEVGDDDYLNYMLGAENRLPERYVDFRERPEGIPFDMSKIDLKSELKAISPLLEMTRDLRLLAIEAQFQALSGHIIGFSECVQGIAILVSTYWSEVHPRGTDGDFTLRQNAISGLNSRATVVTALEYSPIVRDQRSGTLTLRSYQIANGAATARENETALSTNTIVEAMRSEGNRVALDAVHAGIVAALEAVTTIQSSFDEQTSYQFSPDFDLLRGVLAQIKSLIEMGRPDLAGTLTTEAAAETAAVEASADAPYTASAQAGVASVAAARAGTTTIPDRASAAAALLAAEQYFGRHEPSSPALILVHQARMLVGQPLVAALEALVPDTVESAAMVVDSTFGFQFSITKMRAITEDYSSTAEEPEASSEELPVFDAQSRHDAMGLIFGVAAFFRNSEPSSPIPMLLTKAEKFANQNFLSILNDLLPKNTDG